MKVEREDDDYKDSSPPAKVHLESEKLESFIVKEEPKEQEIVIENEKIFLPTNHFKEEKDEINIIDVVPQVEDDDIELGEYTWSYLAQPENDVLKIEKEESSASKKVKSKRKTKKTKPTKYEKKHYPRKESVFQCPICEKTFKFSHLLKQHIGFHDKKFECEYCFKKFATKGKLNAHSREIHENPLSFACKICSKRFNKKSILDDHLKTHDKNREKRYYCEQCPYGTDKRTFFQQHLEAHERNSIRLQKIYSVKVKYNKKDKKKDRKKNYNNDMETKS